METKVEIKEPIETVPASATSEVSTKTFPLLRGGGYFSTCCCTSIIIGIIIVIGFIILSAGSAVYSNNQSNIDARNAIIAGGVILVIGILCCLVGICQVCQDSCDFCCNCHLEYKG